MTKFPVKFPVSRELRAETGSRTTGSSGPINYRNCGPFLCSLSSAFSNFRFYGANKLETYLLSTETGSIVEPSLCRQTSELQPTYASAFNPATIAVEKALSEDVARGSKAC